MTSPAKPASFGRRATSYDVARAAGVSQSAVSRCFAPGGSIAAATRERIVKVANELGYRPNALAQGLISGRTGLVALLISSLTNLYYPEVLDELTRRLTARDSRVLLFSLGTESEVDAVLDQLWRHSIDGAISAARLTDAQIRLFDDHGVPLVLYNRVPDRAAVSSVGCDSAAGERLLVEALWDSGHRSFGIVAGPDDSFVGEDRRRAATERLRLEGHGEVPLVRGDFSYASGRSGLEELVRRAPDIEAVICVNDLMAAGAIDAAREGLGRRVPEDMSVVGFDGSAPASWASYRVTSIRQPVGRMTEAAVGMLMERRADPATPAERRLFAGEFLRGHSARL